MRKTFQDYLFAIREYFATLFVSRLRRRVFAVGVVVIALAGMFLFSNKGLLRRWQLASEKKALEQHLQELQHQEDSLRVLRDKLQSDPFTIEQTAREQYGLAKPGETIYRRAPKQEKK